MFVTFSDIGVSKSCMERITALVLKKQIDKKPVTMTILFTALRSRLEDNMFFVIYLKKIYS